MINNFSANKQNNTEDEASQRHLALVNGYKKNSSKTRAISVISAMFLLNVPTLVLAIEKVSPKKVEGRVYASIKPKETNVRRGPGREYPIAFLIKGKNMPVMVLQNENEWTMIETPSQVRGWVRTSFLSFKNRYGTNLTEQYVCRLPSKKITNCQAIGTLLEKRNVKVLQCNRKWCRIEAKKAIRGWIPKHTIWGVGPNETIK